MAPLRNRKNPKKTEEIGWSVEMVAHLVWSKLHERLEGYSAEQEECLKSGVIEFSKKEKALIEKAIAKERAARAPYIEKVVKELVPAAESFCKKRSPSLKLREHARPLY